MSNQKDDNKPEPKSLWNIFLDRYPNANLSKFKHGIDGYDEEPFVRFIERDGSEFDMFFKKRLQPSLYFSDELKKALGLPMDFPQELTLYPHPHLPIPAIDFGDSQPLRGLNLREKLSKLQIFATPTDSLSVPVRDIFTNTVIKHTSAKETHEWLN